MTLPLRRRHRRIFAVLAVFLPSVFVAGVAARRPVPAVSALPEEIVGAQPLFQSTVWIRHEFFPKTSVGLRLVRESKDQGRYAFALLPSKDFARPDLIVYWVEGTASIAETLPENALLLGAFDPLRPILVPDRVERQSGALVLYSLADGEIVDVSRPFRFNDSTP